MPSARRHGTLACPLGLAEDLGQRKCTLRESGCVSGNFIWACASDRCDGYPADGTLQLAYMIHESNHPHFDTASPVILQIPPRSCIRMFAPTSLPADPCGCRFAPKPARKRQYAQRCRHPKHPGHSTAQAAYRGLPTTIPLVLVHLKQFIRLPIWMVTPSCPKAHHARSPLRKAAIYPQPQSQ